MVTFLLWGQLVQLVRHLLFLALLGQLALRAVRLARQVIQERLARQVILARLVRQARQALRQMLLAQQVTQATLARLVQLALLEQLVLHRMLLARLVQLEQLAQKAAALHIKALSQMLVICLPLAIITAMLMSFSQMITSIFGTELG